MKKKWPLLMATVLLALGIGVAAPAEASDIQVEIDGTAVTFDQPPIIENDRVMVPMRALAEALGAEVGWEGERRMMSSVRGDVTLCIDIGKYVMWKNDAPIILDTAPMIVNGRTLAPIRAVSEGYDCKVDWDGQARMVTVKTSPSITPPQEDPSEEQPPIETPPVDDPSEEIPSVEQPPVDDPPEETPSVEWPPVDDPSEETPPIDSYAYEVFELTNVERVKAGLEPFKWSNELAAVAYAHSKDMSDRQFFSHYNPDGLSPFDRMDDAGITYGTAAENIAAGYFTPADVVEGWMNSPGHRANILSPLLHKLGVGFYEGTSGYGKYWTQCFTN